MLEQKIKSTGELIMIGNDGGKLKSTNYFDTQAAAQGALYLTCNAGHLRLLVPDSHRAMLAEMRTGKRIEIEIHKRDTRIGAGELEYRIFFEDDTGQPFAVMIGDGQCDRKLEPGKCRFLVYTREGLQINFR